MPWGIGIMDKIFSRRSGYFSHHYIISRMPFVKPARLKINTADIDLDVCRFDN
jgi:hypothetical protein